MINTKTMPRVLLEASGDFSEESVAAASFGRDSFPCPLDEAGGALYFGLYKPFGAVYVEMEVVNAVRANLSISYWNGTGWASVSNTIDETRGLSRSGFIQLDRPKDWKKTTVNGLDAFFLKMVSDADLSPETTIQGMNLVFSDDQDLVGVYPSILNFLEETEKSFILRHETARDDIVQWVRNSGEIKKSVELGAHAQIQSWDLLEIEEVRNWSKYLVLANIFSGLQSKDGSIWLQKAEEYTKRASDSRAAFYLSLDTNDDGAASPLESARNIVTRGLTRS